MVDQILPPGGVRDGFLQRPLIQFDFAPQFLHLRPRHADFFDWDGIDTFAVRGGALAAGSSAGALDPAHITAVASGLQQETRSAKDLLNNMECGMGMAHTQWQLVFAARGLLCGGEG